VDPHEFKAAIIEEISIHGRFEFMGWFMGRFSSPLARSIFSVTFRPKRFGKEQSGESAGAVPAERPRQKKNRIPQTHSKLP
jgi:hypothetical protein